MEKRIGFRSEGPCKNSNSVISVFSVVKNLAQQKVFAFDTETDGIDEMQANLIGMSFSWQEGQAYYVPVGHRSRQHPVDRRRFATWGRTPILPDTMAGSESCPTKPQCLTCPRKAVGMAPDHTLLSRGDRSLRVQQQQ